MKLLKVVESCCLVIFDQDGFITLVRGNDEISQICKINKKEKILSVLH